MAFMMPVVKNDWDIYKSNRSRRSSECSNPQICRSRKVSECGSKSDGPSLSTSPGSDFIVNSPAHRSVPANMTSRQYSAQMSSRNSSSSLAQSPGPRSGTSRRCNSEGRIRTYSDSAANFCVVHGFKKQRPQSHES